MKLYRTTVFLDGEVIGSPLILTDSPKDLNYLEVVCKCEPDDARLEKFIETFELVTTERIAKP